MRRDSVLVRSAGMREAKAITHVINTAFRKAESFFIERDRIDLEKVQSLLCTGEFLISVEDGAVTGCGRISACWLWIQESRSQGWVRN
jgi:hypothetical protein